MVFWEGLSGQNTHTVGRTYYIHHITLSEDHQVPFIQ